MNELLQSEYHITSFKKFVDLVETRHSPTVSSPNKWMFRGHDNIKYELKPSIGRLLGTERFIDEDFLYKQEKIAFHNFEVLTYQELKEPNPFILLAVAQHHGLKTRLLDWTFSPFVALFFAVENTNYYHLDGGFFAFHSQNPFTNVLRSGNHPFNDLGAAYQFLSIPALTPRITAQSGVFQLFREPVVPFEDSQYLEKFFIPAKSKKEIKEDLNNFGISYSTLFPDMDGLAKEINYTILNENPI